MSEWKECTIGDLGKIITGKTPRTAITDNYGGDIPFLSPSDNMDVKYVEFTNKTLSNQGVREVKNCLLPEDSVCVSCIGSDLGKVLITIQPTVTNQQINSIIVNEDNNVDFVYYLMTVVGKQLNIISKTSTAVPIINKSSFSNYKITVPKFETQQKIAAILSSLDAKIETNRKINARLEELAHALFKSWFIDFEPFGGQMPEDWKEGVLSDIAAIIMGQSPSGESINNRQEGMIFYQGKTEFGERFPSIKNYTSNITRIAPQNSILLSVRAPVGDVNITLNQCCIGRGIASINYKEGDNSYLYLLMKSKSDYFDIFDKGGTVFGSINKKGLEEMPIIIPSRSVIMEFNGIMYSIGQEIERRYKESARLAELRDTLLPKLMSGELIPE